jgi:hypothetical protein
LLLLRIAGFAFAILFPVFWVLTLSNRGPLATRRWRPRLPQYRPWLGVTLIGLSIPLDVILLHGTKASGGILAWAFVLVLLWATRPAPVEPPQPSVIEED